MITVTEYIAAEMQKPFVPGDTDCATTADRWFFTSKGFSPMQAYGRVVVDSDRMHEWVSEPGGIVRGVKAVMRHSSVPRRHGPSHLGDVGIIIVGRRVCVAIRDVTGWWSRDDDGFIGADEEYRFAAWKVDY